MSTTISPRLSEAAFCRPEIHISHEGCVWIKAFRILIIDGNWGVARGLSRLLRTRGHRVRRAHSGVAALKLAHSFQPEFVLIDASLPDLSGYEIAALLPGIIDSARLRIASVSAYTGEEDICLSQAAGCVCHLRKPVEVAEIEALLAAPGASINSKSQ